MALSNPGKERIQAFISDVDHRRKHAPLNNFTICNLMAEGMLTVKELFPAEFAAYEFDEAQYLKSSMEELLRRRSQGVDVAAEIANVIEYGAAKHPTLVEHLRRLQETPAPSVAALLAQRARSAARNSGIGALRRRVLNYQLARRLENGTQRTGFSASGNDFGFSDILGCAEFLGGLVQRNSRDRRRTSGPSTRATVVMGGKTAADSAASR
jgi:hypothetical protein